MKSIQEVITAISAGQVKQDLSRFDDLYNKLSDIFFVNKNNGINKKTKKILIAVSGGPDSILLSVLIYNFFVKNNLDLNNLFFVHCNHKTRPETDEEQKYVEKFFEELNLSVCVYSDKNNIENIKSKSKTEKNLRDWRYGEFQKIIDQNGIDFLLTGHNLTDRIESSFMNMFRGAGLNGFVSMKFEDQNNLLEWVKIIRPLLWYTKPEIENICDKNNIWFVVDPTNLDKETSLRNNIRLSLFPQFAAMSNKNNDDTNSFFDSMKQIYLELDAKEENNIWEFIKIRQSPYRNSDFAFVRDIPSWFISEDVLLKVFKKFNISAGVKSETLLDFIDFFHSAKQGYKYINWVYFFLSHEKIYIIKAKQNFWEKHIEKNIIIDKLWEIKLWKENIVIDDEKLIWLESRYPKQWDKQWSKSWSKYCINNKIPMFWRNFIPVVVEWENIIKYYLTRPLLKGEENKK